MTTPPPDRPANELAGVVRKVDAEFHEHGKTLSGVADLIGRLEIQRMLVLSTGHIPSGKDLETLNEWSMVVVIFHDNGAIVHVPIDPDEAAECNGPDDDAVPAWLVPIQLFAKAQECGWVNFDSDGPSVLDLPTWNW